MSAPIVHDETCCMAGFSQHPGLDLSDPHCPGNRVRCRHCGHQGPPGDDHTCPCPYTDADCADHPLVR